MAAMEKNSRNKLDKTKPRKVVDIPAGRKSVVLGVTGSIAAYKSAELASLLVKQGHEDTRRGRIYFAAHVADAVEKSGDHELLR
jgi:hypothetical protein